MDKFLSTIITILGKLPENSNIILEPGNFLCGGITFTFRDAHKEAIKAFNTEIIELSRHTEGPGIWLKKCKGALETVISGNTENSELVNGFCFIKTAACFSSADEELFQLEMISAVYCKLFNNRQLMEQCLKKAVKTFCHMKSCIGSYEAIERLQEVIAELCDESTCRCFKEEMENFMAYMDYINYVYNSCFNGIDFDTSIVSIYFKAEKAYKRIFKKNISVGYWKDEKTVDSLLIYYIACRLKDSVKNKYIAEMTRADIAEGINRYMYNVRESYDLRKIIMLEPHPDDIAVSAYSLLMQEKCYTEIYTVSRTEDRRDEIEIMDLNNKLRTNIFGCTKLCLPDYHWDKRADKASKLYNSYEELSQYYINTYEGVAPSGNLKVLEHEIKAVVEKAKAENSILAFQLGNLHPMHIIITVLLIKYIKLMAFRTEDIIIYEDHPYDYKAEGKQLLSKILIFIEEKLGIKLIRTEDFTSINLRHIVKDIYGEEFIGHFDGKLESFNCTYYIPHNSTNKILFSPSEEKKLLYVTTQLFPFAKTGGLADAAASLPWEMKKFKYDVSIIMPKFKTPEIEGNIENMVQVASLEVVMNEKTIPFYVKKLLYNGITIYFIDKPEYFERESLYGYEDEEERFAFFCLATAEALSHLDKKPQVIHCNDWQTALIPYILQRKNRVRRLTNLKTVFTIHAFAYQGVFDRRKMTSMLQIDDEQFLKEGSDYYGQFNFLKLGALYCDKLNTVSMNYAHEIREHKIFEGISYKLTGIINGIDTVKNDPKMDKRIAFNYGTENCLEGKRNNKVVLQKMVGLKETDSLPSIVVVSRLIAHKGMDLIENVLKDLLSEELQLLIIGSGDEYYKSFFEKKAKKYSGKLIIKAYDEKLEMAGYAGADFVLVPSHFEACGTTQLLGMHYGAVPIVSETGGLKDTVEVYNGKDGFGFAFQNSNEWAMLYAIRQALLVYKRQDDWEKIVRRCMLKEVGWEKSAIEYDRLYRK